MINHILSQKKRKIIGVFEFKNRVLNSILKNKTIKPGLRWYLQLKFLVQRKQRSKTRLKNICVLSGRSRSFYGFAKLSRLFLRDNAFVDKVPGLQKSYW